MGGFEDILKAVGAGRWRSPPRPGENARVGRDWGHREDVDPIKVRREAQRCCQMALPRVTGDGVKGGATV